MNELLSHSDKKLIEHLSETAKTALISLEKKEYDFSIGFKGEEYDLTGLLPRLVWIVAAFHDIGKATSFFQEYIREPDRIHGPQKSHALLSALFVWYVVEKFLSSIQIDNDLKGILAAFAFTSVKRHHGKLGDLSNELFFEEYEGLLTEQVDSVSQEAINPLIDELLNGYQLRTDWEEFKRFIKEHDYKERFEDISFDILEDRLQTLPEETRLSLFYLHQLIYSILLFSDKNDVILSGGKRDIPSSDILKRTEIYRKEKGFDEPETDLDRIKNEAFLGSLENLDRVFKKENHLYSVTLPTGMGKTITTFVLADKIRKKLGLKDSKIIVTIPFTSIIDQNFEVFANILKTSDSSLLLKHHHFAEPAYKTNENIADYDMGQFLIETWQSDVVVTTFVQLLETLFSRDKTKLMKLSQLAGSIILLDEIQTIPYPLWEPVREGFKILGKRFNLYFILISATQPLIFNPGEDIFEIVPDYQKFFGFFDRTKLHVMKEPVSFEEFKTIAGDYIAEYKDKDVLLIVNTKKAARELFESIRSEMDADDNELYYLTTLITPFERKKIIKRIKQGSEKRKVIVSTQLVEAGVDISVDTVFRQLAPLDSIIQSTGRANRYSEKQQVSDVFLYDIADLRKASNIVYGSDLLIKTKNVLNGFDETIQETDYLEVIKKYFLEVRKQADNISNDLLPAMMNLEFSKVDLNLIEERKTESVFVQLNEKAKELWEEYVRLYLTEGLKPWEKKEKFSKIKPEFYDFVINVPIPWGRESIVFDSEKQYGFYVSKLGSPSVNYSYSKEDPALNTGYNDREQASVFI